MNDEMLKLMGLDQEVHKMLIGNSSFSPEDRLVAAYAKQIYTYAIRLEARIEVLEEKLESVEGLDDN